MTIHNHTASDAATAKIPSGGPQTSSSINNRVEEVAFDVLLPQEPNTEQLRFELKECGKTGSQYYTIATWKGKRYRITVHENKKKLAYSEGDWQRVEHQTIKVLDRVQNDKHFFKGTLQLHAKTKNKWKVTHENNTPVERSVNKKVIREFKNLLEKQINPTAILPAPVPSQLKKASYSPPNPLYKPAKKEVNFLEFPKKVFEKIKDYLRSLKPNTNEQNTDIEKVEKERSPVKRVKNYFFPRYKDGFDDDELTSNGDRASISSSIEYIDELAEGDAAFDDDNTSLGGISDTSSHVSSDNGSSYSLRVK